MMIVGLCARTGTLLGFGAVSHHLHWTRSRSNKKDFVVDFTLDHEQESERKSIPPREAEAHSFHFEDAASPQLPHKAAPATSSSPGEYLHRYSWFFCPGGLPLFPFVASQSCVPVGEGRHGAACMGLDRRWSAAEGKAGALASQRRRISGLPYVSLAHRVAQRAGVSRALGTAWSCSSRSRKRNRGIARASCWRRTPSRCKSQTL